MKIQFEILDDQFQILKRFQSLASVVKNHIGDLPVALTNIDDYLEQIDNSIANLEYICRKWIIETSVLNQKIEEVEIFENMRIIPIDGGVIDDY